MNFAKLVLQMDSFVRSVLIRLPILRIPLTVAAKMGISGILLINYAKVKILKYIDKYV